MNNTNKLTCSPFSTTNPSIHFVSLSLHKTLRTSGQKPHPFIKNFTQSTLNNWTNKPTSPCLPIPSYWTNKPIPSSPLTLNNWTYKLISPFSTTNPSIHFVSLSLHKTLRTSGQKPYPFIKNFTQSTLNNWTYKLTYPSLPTLSYWTNKPTSPCLPTLNYWSNKLISPCPLVLSDWPSRPIVSKEF